MQTGSHHEVNIDLILDSLDGIERAQPKPFLHTRILARIDKTRSNPWIQTWNFITRPAVSFAFITTILLLNLYTLFQRGTEQADIREEIVAASSVDYESQFVSYYAVNDEQP
jgi:hypothetical protein